MKPISEETIEQTWNRHSEMGDDQAKQLVETFFQQQPALTVYLLAAEESLDTGQESSLVPLAAMIWDAMSSPNAAVKVPKITEEAIEEAEDRNIKFLEQLDQNSEMANATSTQRLLTDYNQRALLGFVLEILMSGNEETPELAPEHIGLELLYLKTVIDCLDRN